MVKRHCLILNTCLHWHLVFICKQMFMIIVKSLILRTGRVINDCIDQAQCLIPSMKFNINKWSFNFCLMPCQDESLSPYIWSHYLCWTSDHLEDILYIKWNEFLNFPWSITVHRIYQIRIIKDFLDVVFKCFPRLENHWHIKEVFSRLSRRFLEMEQNRISEYICITRHILLCKILFTYVCVCGCWIAVNLFTIDT